MANHTPGPWLVKTDWLACSRYEYQEIVHETHPGSIVLDSICTLMAHEWLAKPDERRANAALIAAAPELLEALQVLLDQVDYTAGNCGITEMVGAVLPKEIIQKARTVIAKAKVEP